MTDRIARVWNGSAWEPITSTVSVPNAITYYQSSPPESPITGQIWVDSDSDELYLWNGSSWSDINGFPNQSENSGKFLTTNGTVVSWSSVDSFPNQSENSGKFLTTNGSVVSWSSVDSFPSQSGNSGKFLTTNGSVTSWSNIALANSTSQPAIIAKGIASQTANLQEWQNSSSTVVGSISNGGTISDVSGNLRDIPQNSRASAYTLVASDAGKHISITTGGVTIPASVFGIGGAVSIYNNSSSSQTITQGSSVTLRLAGTATTGNRTLAQYGLCTVLCVASNVFVISGAGIT
jgi:hypothetical protein